MKLYYLPGACSLASRIVLTELNIPFEAVKVQKGGKTEQGADYTAINPKGYVPALELDDGAVITENPAVLQYIADQKPDAQLVPAAGTMARVRVQESLNFVGSELHKAFGPYFSGRDLEGDEKSRVESQLARRLDDVERDLADGRHFVVGDHFTVADAYLWVVLNWSGFVGVTLDKWPHAAAYHARLSERPAVRAALVQEGLIKA